MITDLFVHWHVDPVLLHLGKFGIRWYSLMFLAGFILGWYLFRWFFRREGISEKLLDPLLLTLVAATIIGARLGHCIFYQPDYYFSSWNGFWEVFMPWQGGLASHGGAIALLLAMWWFTRRHGAREGFDFLWLMDRLCIAVAFVGCLIRLGNLFNSEIYGDTTTLPWGFVFDLRGETEPKHPTQIYEAGSYLLLGLVLLWCYARKLDKVHRGFFFGLFLVGCFGMRFLIEFIKEPQVEFEQAMALDMGQWLSVPFILAGICLLVYGFAKKQPAALPAKKSR
ncbi:MAG: prolipoprotein diacylglyceryl transferase [Bacteroidales bacterium]|nr:prolipoprotein diacylglyceryl transferase [Bacteroidales bacterium]